MRLRIAQFSALMLACMLAAPAFAQTAADDLHVLSVIRRNLANPNRVTYNNPFVFVGEITGFGPIFQGVCKEGVNQEVDFSISKLIYGDFDGSTIRARYINCSRAPLPSPPFAQHAKLIVYCERPHDSISCLNPVSYSNATLHEIRRWIAGIHPADSSH